jgi:DNA modification methylase
MGVRMNWNNLELPEPYYQDDAVYIINADCREVLPSIPDKSIDLVLTDPPYGIGVANKDQVGGSVLANNTKHIVSDWDDKPIDQVTINQAIFKAKHAMVFGGNYYAMPPSPCWLIWNKRGDYPSNNFADCELIWTSMSKPSRIYKYFWQGMLQQDMKNKDYHYHPTQKPISVMRWCITQADNPQTILDPFMGSGTTLRAALDLNRKCIGIEIEEKYCEIAAKRCSQSVMKMEV